MKKRITKKTGTGIMAKQLHLGRFGFPLWSLGLTAGLMAAAAGTAVGPVLAGSVSGSVGATVEQAVLVKSAPSVGASPAFANAGAADDSVGIANDEGSSFMVGIETQVGQNQAITIPLINESGQTANAVLELIVPAGVDVEVESTSGVKEAQIGPSKWLMSIPPGTTPGDLVIDVEPRDDLKPGFYSITGRIVQIAG